MYNCSVFNTTLSSLFPAEYTPTAQQVRLLEKIENGLANNKFIICCAPTGSGKSLIARTVAELSKDPTERMVDLIRSYDAFRQDFTGNFQNEEDCTSEPAFGAFALTITKSLQDQYQGLFTTADVLKGKSNYICDIDDDFTVDLAPCTFAPKIKESCWASNRCHYYNARNDALLSRFGVLNYKMFLALPKHIKRKNIIICDEASELEEELIRRFSAEVNYDKLTQYGITQKVLISDNKERARVWIYELVEKINCELERFLELAGKKQDLISKADRVKYQYLKNLHKSLTDIDSLWSNCDYIIDVDATKVSFTPLQADVLTNHVFDFADKVILMSATIIDHKHYAKSLGITKYEYIECESEFDPQRSPIYISTASKLNYKNLRVELPKICEQIKAIVNHHSGDKGVIHTHTQEITNIIREKLGKDTRYLFRDVNSNNETILKEHRETEMPTVLVSPSLTFGVDLKDELARFQIIVKLPFLPLSSKRIKKMFELDKVWYENKMLNAIVQAAGRATRSKDDHSVTYILDGNFINVISRAKNKLPKHFIDRIQ